MMELLILIGITVLLLALAFSGIAIKMFLKKGGQFEKKSCCSTGETVNSSCACSVNSDR
ncbi:MAG: hypothetical protein PF489_00720 [Salinivirgaceae bacterium]|jgi:flagellar basal body-associated protein FliL|nr:hypothetical protein [Salinivirgaceae bacterium]